MDPPTFVSSRQVCAFEGPVSFAAGGDINEVPIASERDVTGAAAVRRWANANRSIEQFTPFDGTRRGDGGVQRGTSAICDSFESLLVVVAALDDTDLVCRDLVDEPVLGGDSTGPVAAGSRRQRLRLADAGVAVACDVLDQRVDATQYAVVLGLPVEVGVPDKAVGRHRFVGSAELSGCSSTRECCAPLCAAGP